MGVVGNNIPEVSNRLPGVPKFDQEDYPSDYPDNGLTDGHDITNGQMNEPTYPKLSESKLINSDQVQAVAKQKLIESEQVPAGIKLDNQVESKKINSGESEECDGHNITN